MRLAILTNAYPPKAQGGAGRMAYLQAEALRALGHDVRVWHEPIRWTAQSVPSRLAHHLKDLWSVPPIATEIRAWQPDVLLTHNLTGIGFRTPHTIQSSNCRWIHVLHDVQLFEPSGQCLNWDTITHWQRLWSSLRRTALGRPDLVVSPTQVLLEAHRVRGFFQWEDTKILPNPAPVFCAPATRLRHQPLRLLFIGRWSKDKGSELIEALWSRPGSSDYEWHLIGPGTEQIKPPHGRGYGSCSETEIFARMAESDALLVPSQIMENQPTVLLEAMAHGLPVIASKQAGIEETLQGAGSLCVAEDVAAWEAVLHEFATESDASYQERAAKMASVWSRYNPVRSIQGLVDVLTSKRKI